MSMLANVQESTWNAASIFRRILVGIDGSPESLEAVSQAAVLEEAGGTSTLLAAWTVAPPVVTPVAMLPTPDADERAARAEAEQALRDAQDRFPTATGIVVHARPTHALLAEIERADATLVALGSHGRKRVEGILFGSVATQLVHDAPCPVLVARESRERHPRRIAVGVDGSPQSAVAYAAACYLADRFDGEVTVVVAEGADVLDVPGVSLIVGDDFRVISDDPVRVLAAASADADLLVVGSRGLHGVKAVGSVSERVAHRAACSTLIVRQV